MSVSPTLRALVISPEELSKAITRGDVVCIRTGVSENYSPQRCTYCHEAPFRFPDGRLSSLCGPHLIEARERSRKYYARLKAEGRRRSY